MKTKKCLVFLTLILFNYFQLINGDRPREVLQQNYREIKQKQTPYQEISLEESSTSTLRGPNICIKEITVQEEIEVKKVVPYKIKQWYTCDQWPPICRREITNTRTVISFKNITKQKTSNSCCDGYSVARTAYNSTMDACLPTCITPCGQFDCIEGSCRCGLGLTGEQCNRKCSTGWWGAGCIYQCECTGNLGCNSLTGKCNNYKSSKPRKSCSCSGRGICTLKGTCSCYPGWRGKTCAVSEKLQEECRQNCPCMSKNVVRYDFKNNMCKCKPGWIGQICQINLVLNNATFKEEHWKDNVVKSSSKWTISMICTVAIIILVVLIIPALVFIKHVKSLCDPCCEQFNVVSARYPSPNDIYIVNDKDLKKTYQKREISDLYTELEI